MILAQRRSDVNVIGWVFAAVLREAKR